MKSKRILISAAALAAASSIIASCNASAEEQGRIIPGDERMELYLPMLEGKRVAVYSNQTGVLDSDGRHIVDVLIGEGVNVCAIFSPEHGFRGTADAGEHVASSVDAETGVPILSLYGGDTEGEDASERPSYIPRKEDMEKFDIIVVDIQDVGLRFYTYYITMCHLMEACSLDGREMIILDRPNPNGCYVDGPILDTENLRSGVGWIPIPIVHGMTLGELALMINGEGWLEGRNPCKLEVIPCAGYTHASSYELKVNPSPNLKCMHAIYLYPSTCFFEGTPVTPGRGTDFPFETYGHPDMNGCDFEFTPHSMEGAKSPLFEGQICHGIDLRNVPVEDILSAGVNLEYVIDAYEKMGRPGNGFFNRHFDLLAGQTWIREMIVEGESAAEIRARWSSDVENFLVQRRPYLLYDE